jgi:hypothetical protein
MPGLSSFILYGGKPGTHLEQVDFKAESMKSFTAHIEPIENVPHFTTESL